MMRTRRGTLTPGFFTRLIEKQDLVLLALDVWFPVWFTKRMSLPPDAATPTA